MNDPNSNAEEASVFVACGCLINDGEGRYLLVRETKSAARGRLALPAGKLEAGESLSGAAARETHEETGLQVDVGPLLGIFHTPKTSEGSFGINFVFAATAVAGELTPTTEHPEFAWLSLAEIDELARGGGLRGQHAVAAAQAFEAGVALPGDIVTVLAASPFQR